MSRKIKYIDKQLLQRVNYLSNNVLKYNRTLPPELVDALPDDKVFPIVFTMLHEHKAGVPCEPHVRCIIAAPGNDDKMQQLILDMETGIFDLLPEFTMPDTAPDTSDEPEPVSAA